MIDQLESELRSALRARADELPAGAGARVRAHEYRPRTRDLRPPVAAGVVTTAVAAAAVVALVDLGPQAPAAFAGWSATPTQAPVQQVAGARGACAAKLTQLRSSAAQTGSQRPAPLLTQLTKLSATAPVLTDTRGPFTSSLQLRPRERELHLGPGLRLGFDAVGGAGPGAAGRQDRPVLPDQLLTGR